MKYVRISKTLLVECYLGKNSLSPSKLFLKIYIACRDSESGEVVYGGWARMALPIASFAVVEVAKPHIGEKKPSRVRADISVTLSVRREIKEEWENLRKHDVCFLITVRPTQPYG